MVDDKYSFRPPECWKCGKSLARAKSPVTGMKANVPLGYCPKCGASNPLTDVEPTDEPTEPVEPAEPPIEPPAEPVEPAEPPVEPPPEPQD